MAPKILNLSRMFIPLVCLSNVKCLSREAACEQDTANQIKAHMFFD